MSFFCFSLKYDYLPSPKLKLIRTFLEVPEDKVAKTASSARTSAVADGEMLQDEDKLIGKYLFRTTIISTIQTCIIPDNFHLMHIDVSDASRERKSALFGICFL